MKPIDRTVQSNHIGVYIRLYYTLQDADRTVRSSLFCGYRGYKMAYREEFSQGDRSEPALMEGKGPGPSSTDVAAQPQALASAPPQPKRKFKFGKKPILLAVLGAALAFGVYEGNSWWTTGRFMVSTDDAY